MPVPKSKPVPHILYYLRRSAVVPDLEFELDLINVF